MEKAMQENSRLIKENFVSNPMRVAVDIAQR